MNIKTAEGIPVLFEWIGRVSAGLKEKAVQLAQPIIHQNQL
jgi:hypothetical protein